MKVFQLAMAGGLAAVLGWGGVADAQNNSLNSFGGTMTSTPTGAGPGAYAVAPSLPGSGGTYSYVQQNLGRGVGMSPSAYYSQNYFTQTPMYPSAPYAYQSSYYPAGAPVQRMTAAGYTAPTYSTTPYSNANAAYYNARRGGPLRRMFGRR